MNLLFVALIILMVVLVIAATALIIIFAAVITRERNHSYPITDPEARFTLLNTHPSEGTSSAPVKNE